MAPLSPIAITDPLSVGHDRQAVARDRLRRAASWLYGTCAVTLLFVLVAPDPDPSDHLGLAAIGVVCGLRAPRRGPVRAVA
jgi:hypothetical protein